VQFLKRLPVPSVPNDLRADISRLAHDVVAAALLPAEVREILPFEIRLNELVENAFALTDSERRVLVSNLPPRDPIQVLEAR